MPEGGKARGWAGRRSLRRERAGGLRAARLGLPDEGAWQVVGGEHGVRCQRGGARYEALYVGAGVLYLPCGVWKVVCAMACGMGRCIWYLGCCVCCVVWWMWCGIWAVWHVLPDV